MVSASRAACTSDAHRRQTTSQRRTTGGDTSMATVGRLPKAPPAPRHPLPHLPPSQVAGDHVEEPPARVGRFIADPLRLGRQGVEVSSSTASGTANAQTVACQRTGTDPAAARTAMAGDKRANEAPVSPTLPPPQPQAGAVATGQLDGEDNGDGNGLPPRGNIRTVRRTAVTNGPMKRRCRRQCHRRSHKPAPLPLVSSTVKTTATAAASAHGGTFAPCGGPPSQAGP